MKVTVTPYCEHPANETGTRYHSTGEPFIGQRVMIGPTLGVILDGVAVIRRDRRALRNREAGHNWTTDNGRTDQYNRIPWTGFRVAVEP